MNARNVWCGIGFFAAGAVVGIGVTAAAVCHCYGPGIAVMNGRPDRAVEKAVRRVSCRLDLDEGQKEAFRESAFRAAGRLGEVQDEFFPRVEEILAQLRFEMADRLDPAQREELDALISRLVAFRAEARARIASPSPRSSAP